MDPSTTSVVIPHTVRSFGHLESPVESTKHGEDGNINHMNVSLRNAESFTISKPTKKRNCVQNCLGKASDAIIWGLEKGFFRARESLLSVTPVCHPNVKMVVISGVENKKLRSTLKLGLFVGTYPVLTIFLSVAMCSLCGLGMKTFHETEEQEKLWVPQSSRLIPEKKWVDRAFPQETRYVTVLMVNPGGSILTPTSINALMDYYIQSTKIKVNGKKFVDLCMPIGPFCYVSSLLELWGYNEAEIRSLNQSEILEMINITVVSPISGVDVTTLLGGDITRDSSGKIMEAEATQITWTLKKDEDNSDAADWEKQMINLALKGHANLTHTYVYASRSFDDEGYGAIDSDFNLLTTGFSIVFIFVLLSLGKFNLIEQKVYVSLSGMVCVGLAILVAYGVATALSVIYSPIQGIMPFLLLGIGVDDMFVVIEAWKNLSPEEQKLDPAQKLGITLSKAGMSITVTSITDIVAFGIGATTVIPALSSFCIYATLGIFALYVLVSTLFCAVLALDERRRQAGRDACIFCYKRPEDYSPNQCSQGRSFLQVVFADFYGPLLLKQPVKVLVIALAVGMTVFGFYRFVQMEQDFDLIQYIPSDSYAYSFARTREFYFNRQGVSTSIYCGGFNYFEEQPHLDSMYTKVSNSSYIQPGTVNSWFTAYHSWLTQESIQVTSSEEYNHHLYEFLQSPSGRRFSSFVKFNSSTEPVSILASYITLTHIRQPDSASDVRSMDALRDIIDGSGFPRFDGSDMPEYMCLTYTTEYMTYETNKVLQGELYRNLGLAAAAVLVVTLVLVANLLTSLLVFICVLFTVIDVGGVLELWGTTIDTASSILLTLSVGLAVDYSAHIGHTFMTITGTRNNRAVATLKSIGPAVFNGGLSTLLAFVLLANSTSYGFQLFFRVFMAVVVFGLFHGLVFLPVILSLLGPKAYQDADKLLEEVEAKVEVPPGAAEDVESHVNNRSEFTAILTNGHLQEPKKGVEGPLYSLFKQPDETEEKNSRKMYVSVVDVKHSQNQTLTSPLPTVREHEAHTDQDKTEEPIDVTPKVRSKESSVRQSEGVTKL